MRKKNKLVAESKKDGQKNTKADIPGDVAIQSQPDSDHYTQLLHRWREGAPLTNFEMTLLNTPPGPHEANVGSISPAADQFLKDSPNASNAMEMILKLAKDYSGLPIEPRSIQHMLKREGLHVGEEYIREIVRELHNAKILIAHNNRRIIADLPAHEAEGDSMKPGGGGRFKALSHKLAHRGVRVPKALAAFIGRKKYGKKKMQKMAAAHEAIKKGVPSRGTVDVDGVKWNIKHMGKNHTEIEHPDDTERGGINPSGVSYYGRKLEKNEGGDGKKFRYQNNGKGVTHPHREAIRKAAVQAHRDRGLEVNEAAVPFPKGWAPADLKSHATMMGNHDHDNNKKTDYKHMSTPDKQGYHKAKQNYQGLSADEKSAFHRDWEASHQQAKRATFATKHPEAVHRVAQINHKKPGIAKQAHQTMAAYHNMLHQKHPNQGHDYAERMHRIAAKKAHQVVSAKLGRHMDHLNRQGQRSQHSPGFHRDGTIRTRVPQHHESSVNESTRPPFIKYNGVELGNNNVSILRRLMEEGECSDSNPLPWKVCGIDVDFHHIEPRLAPLVEAGLVKEEIIEDGTTQWKPNCTEAVLEGLVEDIHKAIKSRRGNPKPKPASGMITSRDIAVLIQQVREAIDEAAAEKKPSYKMEKLAKHYVQFIQSGNSFRPAGEVKLESKLHPFAYRINIDMQGPYFTKFQPKTDELYHFKDSAMQRTLEEIDKFWGLKENFDALGLLHRRGIILHGPPGMGKSCLIQQVAEMMCERGDIVLFASGISTLKEAFQAMREVEPDRRVVIVLEDSDEYIGHSERSMLQLMDGDDTFSNVLFLATTNYLERFPPRLLRPGRFDKHIYVGPINYEGRLTYLNHKLSKVEESPEIERLAQTTDGFSFGHLKELIVGAYAMKEPVESVMKRLRKTALPAGSSRAEVDESVDGLVWTKETPYGMFAAHRASDPAKIYQVGQSNVHGTTWRYFDQAKAKHYIAEFNGRPMPHMEPGKDYIFESIGENPDGTTNGAVGAERAREAIREHAKQEEFREIVMTRGDLLARLHARREPADEAKKMTPDEQQSFLFGQQAFKKGMKKVPALDQQMLDKIKKVNGPMGSSLPLLTAWHRGWDKENLAAPVKEGDVEEMAMNAARDELILAAYNKAKTTKRVHYVVSGTVTHRVSPGATTYVLVHPDGTLEHHYFGDETREGENIEDVKKRLAGIKPEEGLSDAFSNEANEDKPGPGQGSKAGGMSNPEPGKIESDPDDDEDNDEEEVDDAEENESSVAQADGRMPS